MYKSKLKKYLASVLSVLTFATCLTIGGVAFGEDVVDINETNFADENFRKIVSAQCDTNSDGLLQPSERTMTSLPLSSWRDMTLGEDAVIEDLKGIEYFTHVTSLTASDLGLKTLDLSKNSTLVTVRCSGNNALESLTLGTLKNLKTLDCSACQLTSLDVSGCTGLTKLLANVNKIVSLDVSKNTALTNLSVYQNELTALNLTYNTSLNMLKCNNNHISELDLSSNTRLAVTESDIGNQWVNSTAYINNNVIYVAYTFLNSSNLISSTLDEIVESDDGEVNNLAYKGNSFYASELKDISKKLTSIDDEVLDGFSYKYSVNNANCEPLSVNVVVDKNFYQVNFYTDETKSERISYQLVRKGTSATAPTVENNDTCKEFSAWSESFANVNDDLDVYAKWNDNHDIVKNINEETGDIDIHCTKCNRMDINFNFAEAYNKTSNEEGYVEVGDRNNDGIINAKDYVMIRNIK